ncbi:Cu/Zn superoxide dismutase [Salmonella enterica subsp. enterica serovar Choleraesuis str. 0006]|nr:Cu/Zn superoxide dismutase [Salmonella enterica subsp. enterica serovar Choleraesuis str. 0006]
MSTQTPSCMPGMKDGKEVPALMAGGHLDPEKPGNILAHIMTKGIWGICLDWLSMQMVQPRIRYWHHALNHCQN